MSTRRKTALLLILLTPIAVGILTTFLRYRRDIGLPLQAAVSKVGLVQINDVIYTSGEYVRRLRDLLEDRTVRGVILRIDSPGGAVAPSQEIYAEVLRYRQTGKPLVVSMGNVAASGGYYIAAPAQRIFANPGTLTGSIGVILQFPRFQGLMDKLGIEMETIKAGRYKDVANPHRAVTSQERALLQALLDDTHGQFIGDVAAVRSIDYDTLRMVADGRILNGRQAQRVGLVDTLGTYQDALDYLKGLLGLPHDVKVVEKKERGSFIRELIEDEVISRLPLPNVSRRPAGCYFLMQPF